MRRPRAAPKDPEAVTMLQIARRAGVSLSTVSRVLSNAVPVTADKRTAVLSAVEPAPSLVRRESREASRAAKPVGGG